MKKYALTAVLLSAVVVLGAGRPIKPPPVLPSVTLAWDAAEDDVDGYKLYVLSDTQAELTVFDTGTNQIFTVTGLQKNTQYYFAATAYRDGLESDFSEEVGYKTPRK